VYQFSAQNLEGQDYGGLHSVLDSEHASEFRLGLWTLAGGRILCRHRTCVTCLVSVATDAN